MVRTVLYQAAHVPMNHCRWSSLLSWAMWVAKRHSFEAAKGVLARNLSVVMSRMWVVESDSVGPTQSQP